MSATEPAAPPRLLPVGYYVDNFATVLDTVASRYDDLLTAEEKRFRSCFHALPLGARRLYVRLVSRRRLRFRLDLLAYPEVGDLAVAVAELEDVGLADRDPQATLGDRLAALRRPELALLLAEREPRRPPSSARREDLVALLETAPEAELATVLASRWPLVRPLHQETVLVYRLLFFGNLSQDFHELVLSDLGVVRYEPYPLERRLRLFPERRAIDEALFLRQLRHVVELLLADGKVEPAAKLSREVAAGEWHPLGRPILDRLRVRVGRELERRGDLTGALDLYADAAPARERRVRVLSRLGRDAEAVALCAAMAADPLDETEAEVAPRLLRRLRRMAGEPVEPLARPRRPRRRLVVPRDLGLPVEEQVLVALGRPGFHAENWLWRTLFGLAFWDVVFAPLPGAFEQPFQLGPLDLHGPEFRRARAVLVDARLAELRAERDPTPRLLDVWERKAGTANALVAWEPWRRPLVELALSRLDGATLAHVCDRLARDPGRYRRGLPDLFVARDGAPGFELLEVKAPGDQLRPEQGAWIDYLLAGGIPVEVVDVRWADAGSTPVLA